MVAIKVTSCTWGWAMSAEVACGDDVYSEALWWTMTGLRISSPLQPPLLWHESLNQLSPVTTNTQACARFKVETVCSQTFVSNIGRIREVEHVFYTTMDRAMCVIVVLAPFMLFYGRTSTELVSGLAAVARHRRSLLGSGVGRGLAKLQSRSTLGSRLAQLGAVKLVMEKEIGAVQFDLAWPKVLAEKRQTRSLAGRTTSVIGSQTSP